MTDQELLAEYTRRRAAVLAPLAEGLGKHITERLAGVKRIDRISARAKGPDRFLAKATKEKNGKRKYGDPFSEIQDQVAARVTVFYLRDVETVETVIKKYFGGIEEITVKEEPQGLWLRRATLDPRDPGGALRRGRASGRSRFLRAADQDIDSARVERSGARLGLQAVCVVVGSTGAGDGLHCGSALGRGSDVRQAVRRVGGRRVNVGVPTAAKRPMTGGRKPYQLELDKGEGGNKPRSRPVSTASGTSRRAGND